MATFLDRAREGFGGLWPLQDSDDASGETICDFKAQAALLSMDAMPIWLSPDAINTVARLSTPLLLDGADGVGFSRQVDWEYSVWTGSATSTEDKKVPVLHQACSDEEAATDDAGVASSMNEEAFLLARQVFPVFLLAGGGMVAAGLLLAHVRKWTVFIEVREILILVPALLGLKGNLEMTLASRLCTHANLGHLDGGKEMYSIIVGNLSVVQCQAIVVGFLASVVAVGMNFVTVGTLEPSHVLLLASSAVTAASIASFALAVIMVALVLVAHHFRINPDNIASPIAGMLGDCVTLVLISGIAQVLWLNSEYGIWIQVATLLGYCAILPMCWSVAVRNSHAAIVLREGWTPTILAMLISSVGGLILKHSDMVFPHLAPFAPVTNGAAGNLAAVQASRISTDLHSRGKPGTAIEPDDKHAQSGLTLVLLVVPGALFFVTVIVGVVSQGTALPGLRFLFIYVVAVLVQARVLVSAARALVVGLWRNGADPDNGAIPYVTALGDVVGTGVLTAAFCILQLIGGEPWQGAA